MAKEVNLEKYKITQPSVNLEKYRMKTVTEPKKTGGFSGFLGDIVKSAIGSVLVRPAVKTGQAIGALGISTFGTPEMKERLPQSISQSTQFGPITIPAQKTGFEGIKQSIGAGLEGASYLYGAGGVAPIARATLGGLVRQGARLGAVTGGVGGALFGAGEELQRTGDVTQAGISALGGGALGAVTGGTLGATAPVLPLATRNITNIRKAQTPEGFKNLVQDELTTFLNKNKGLQNQLRKLNQKNVPIVDILSDQQVYRGLKTENSAVVPDESIQYLQDITDRLLDAKGQMLPEVDRLVPEGVSKKRLLDRAINDFRVTNLPPADQTKVINSIKRQVNPLPNQISLTELDQLRARFRAGSRNAQGIQKSSSEYSALENAARDIVFDVTDNLPLNIDRNKQFSNLNTTIKNNIETINFLDRVLRGQKVEGGRLGQYVARGIGAVAGSQGGPLGVIIGSEVGGAVSRILQNNNLGSSFKMSLIRNLTDDPAIIKASEEFLSSLRQTQLPQLPSGIRGLPSQVSGGRTIQLPPRGNVPVGLGDEPPARIINR